mmetsp:Transcript_17879/g.24821  ORF Transcript_17879/g.24821 Transcript_17879/m.24821 type:complete len:511 (-) Transcript_17879:64-1596(-)|eukprot:CAMPEP_0201476608 /NCGR_PEP_ID=MMETSP0151_2-20130828/1780_1 /ASSEMBLY_ACC=CAM_ASM_000257 /TAXON_ID=200890 /ORGANISM="Paramoeba atlantica, Strain 621/1 / CCAP 1560/9" /LENGTH=510 /DNA_ID=CAMNT_0047857023 /DNA_START=43 /DNA_END=1575 /DNA_ORIENTATION=-
MSDSEEDPFADNGNEAQPPQQPISPRRPPSVHKSPGNFPKRSSAIHTPLDHDQVGDAESDAALLKELEELGALPENELDDIILEKVQKLSPDELAYQLEMFGRLQADNSIQKMELEAMEHQLEEDFKNLQETLGLDAEQVTTIKAQIEDLRKTAMQHKGDRMKEFKDKKKNLNFKKKIEEEVYTIKSKYEEKIWEQVEMEDANRALEKEDVILTRILEELSEAKKTTIKIQDLVPEVSKKVDAKIKEMLEVEQFKDKFIMELLDCKSLLRKHSLLRMEKMNEVENRVSSLKKKAELASKQHDFAEQIIECLAELTALQTGEAEIYDMRIQFEVLLQVEVDALYHILNRVRGDRERYTQQILAENKEKDHLLSKLKGLNVNFQMILDKAHGVKKTQAFVTELIEEIYPFQEQLQQVLPHLSRIMYEDLIPTSHRDRLELAKEEVQSLGGGMDGAVQHYDYLVGEVDRAMRDLQEMKAQRQELGRSIDDEIATIVSLQRQLTQGKGKGKKKK